MAKPTAATIQETTPINPQDLLTDIELAKRLKVPPGWVREKARRRKQGSTSPLPFFKCGKYRRFHWPTVSAWLLTTQRNGKAVRG